MKQVFLMCILIGAVLATTETSNKERNLEKRSPAVGSIVYATKPSPDGQSHASPSSLLAKQSPYTTQAQYATPVQQIIYRSTLPQTPTAIDSNTIQPKYNLAVAPQQYLVQAPVKLGYAQQVAPAPRTAIYATQPEVQYVRPDYHQQGPQVFVDSSRQAAYQTQQPVYVTQAAPEVKYVQQAQPAPQVKYVQQQPQVLQKIGYATSVVPQQKVQYQYSPASSVSQFSYSSPYVTYNSNGGILSQSSYESPNKDYAQQVAYETSPQAVYTLPQGHLTPAYTKIGYATPGLVSYVQ